MPTIIYDGPDDAGTLVVLAHGAGAPMDSPFMETMAVGLAQTGLRVGRFEFPYMARRREQGRRPGPDPAPRLLDAWREVIGESGAEGIVIGGKSLGGRMASMLADECGVRGLVCLGYPFHPPGKPDKVRTAHLETLRTATLILQGERDPFGNRADVDGYTLSDAIEVRWLADGDHSFVPRKRSGRTEFDNLTDAVRHVASFVETLRGM